VFTIIDSGAEVIITRKESTDKLRWFVEKHRNFRFKRTYFQFMFSPLLPNFSQMLNVVLLQKIIVPRLLNHIDQSDRGIQQLQTGWVRTNLFLNEL